MSRMYNQTGNLYKGVFDCLYKTVSTEGLLAIYKGFLPHLARILPHTVSAVWELSNRANPSDLDAQLGGADESVHAQGRGAVPL